MEMNLRHRWLQPRSILDSARVNGLISAACLSGMSRSRLCTGVCAAEQTIDGSMLSLALVFPDGRQAQGDIEWADGQTFLIERDVEGEGSRRVALPREGEFTFGGVNRVLLSDSEAARNTIPFELRNSCLDLSYLSLEAMRVVDPHLDTQHEDAVSGLHSWLRAHRSNERISVLLWLMDRIDHEWKNGGGSPAIYVDLIRAATSQMNWIQANVIEPDFETTTEGTPSGVLRVWRKLASTLWRPGHWCSFDDEYVDRGTNAGLGFVYVRNGVQRRLVDTSDATSATPICAVDS